MKMSRAFLPAPGTPRLPASLAAALGAPLPDLPRTGRAGGTGRTRGGAARRLMLVCTGLLTLGIAACDRTSPAEPWASRNLVGGLDLQRLFAPPSDAELAAVRSDWQGRTPVASGVQVELDALVALGDGAGNGAGNGASATLRLRVLSHLSGGDRHVGALITPPSLPTLPLPDASLAVLVYGHGGETGVDLGEVFEQLPAFGIDPTQVALLIPAFGGESLRFGPGQWLASGSSDPWDGDVDDALDLLETALQADAALDASRIGVLGFSRGGAVGLLMAARDPRIDAVVSFAAPTDFFGEFVQSVVRETLVYGPPDLPGAAALDESVLQPMQSGIQSLDWGRLELARRSTAWFAADLPAVQLHHGTADDVVPPSETERLMTQLVAAGRGEPEVEAHFYAGGGHDPLTMPLAIQRTTQFLLERLQAVPVP